MRGEHHGQDAPKDGESQAPDNRGAGTAGGEAEARPIDRQRAASAWSQVTFAELAIVYGLVIVLAIYVLMRMRGDRDDGGNALASPPPLDPGSSSPPGPQHEPEVRAKLEGVL